MDGGKDLPRLAHPIQIAGHAISVPMPIPELQLHAKCVTVAVEKMAKNKSLCLDCRDYFMQTVSEGKAISIQGFVPYFGSTKMCRGGVGGWHNQNVL